MGKNHWIWSFSNNGGICVDERNLANQLICIYIYVYIVYIEMQCNPVSYKVRKISQLVSQISSIIRMNSLNNKQYVYGRLRGSQINFC